MSKYCAKCNKEGDARTLIPRTVKTVISGNSSSGCSIRTYWFCYDCLPKERWEPKPNIVVGKVVSISN